MENQPDQGVSSNAINDIPRVRRQPTINANLTTDRLIDVLSKQNEISMTLARCRERASLPKKELQVFDGKDLSLFNSFMQTFRRIIEKKCNEMK